MAERSRYQERLIRNYYKNQDTIELDKLSGLVGDLYLATGKKQERLWDSARLCLEKLKVPPVRIGHVLDERKPELLARLVEELSGKT
ncbi:MAG: hypothetical protein R3C10_01765 [Pirellulales bacterium]|nr:hypothetical protein [Planctomycetales bacterium]